MTALFVVLPTVVAEVAEKIELMFASVSMGTSPVIVPEPVDESTVDVDGIDYAPGNHRDDGGTMVSGFISVRQ